MIDHRTHTDITGTDPNTPPEVKVYPCTCEYRKISDEVADPDDWTVDPLPGYRWFLCAFHAGFDVACERFAP
jgi:hypothetical protein